MARSNTKTARRFLDNDAGAPAPDVPFEDETLTPEECRNVARAGRDRAAGRFVPLDEALDVARRARSLRRSRARARRTR